MYTGVVILNYNNAADTIHCLESIERFNTAPVKYIVVDNGSSKPGEVEAIDGFLKEAFGAGCTRVRVGEKREGPLPKVTFVLNDKNEGYAVGNNRGLSFAFDDPEITGILLLNNDVLFVQDVLPRLIEDAASLERCGIVTPLLLKRDGKTVDGCCARRFVSNWNVMVPFLLHNRDWFGWITRNSNRQRFLDGRSQLLEAGDPFPIDYPSGSCLYVDKELFRSIGAFDPETFLYYEEIILYRKLQAAGRQNYCDPAIRVIHLGGSSTRMSDNSFLQKCNLESADIYFRKYGNCTLPQKAVWALTKAAWRVRLWLKRFKR